MRLGPWRSPDDEKRMLRIEVAKLRRAHSWQKEQAGHFKKENTKLKNELKFKDEAITQLEEELKKVEKQRDRYRAMVFKQNIDPEEPAEENAAAQTLFLSTAKGKKKRGAQPGHPGHGRKKPERVDEIKRVYLECCPDCGTALPRSKEIHTHTVEDIPPFEKDQTKVTLYEEERQWCATCKKKVSARPAGVVPHCRLGINLLLYVLIQKYGTKTSWETIVFNLKVLYGVTVSEGALVDMVHRVRKLLGKSYAALIEEIRAAPVKHADETGWRVNGSNHWLWGFFTPTCAYYAVEESRGKGVPEKALAGSHPEDVLVRDDYGAYTKLLLRQQSCWSHLLRVSREAAEDVRASSEVKELNVLLKKMFLSLQAVLAQPFEPAKRKLAYEKFKQMIENIINSNYRADDAREIQTRIARQNTNLITALLHENVPLTNNLAERQLRPMVVVRKISGGSRSWEGAKTQAVNMSIFQTIRMRQQPLIQTLQKMLLPSLPQN